MWYDPERAPTWVDWQAFASLMGHALTPLDLRMLRHLHTARQDVAARSREHAADGR